MQVIREGMCDVSREQRSESEEAMKDFKQLMQDHATSGEPDAKFPKGTRGTEAKKNKRSEVKVYRKNTKAKKRSA